MRMLLILLMLVSCGKDGSNGKDGSDGKDGVSCYSEDFDGGVKVICGDKEYIVHDGIDGQNGADGKDLTIESKVFCYGMYDDHPSYYGVYPSIYLTFFTNKTFMVHAEVVINQLHIEPQGISDTVWGEEGAFPHVSVLNIEYWYFGVENGLFTFSDQSGSYKKTFTNCSSSK